MSEGMEVDSKENHVGGETPDPVKKESVEIPPEIKSKFPPTTIVLAKVKGYPHWPAMILEESLLPSYVLDKKPKGKKITLPVRFFSDDTYIWMKVEDIKLLKPETIDEFLSKTRKDKLLTYAYELAKDPMDMELFVNYGSRGKPLLPVEPDHYEQLEEEEEEEAVSEDEVKPKKRAPKKTTKSKKPVAKKTKEEPKKRGRKPAEKETKRIKLEFKYDDDWGIEEDLDDMIAEGNYIFDDKQQEKQFLQEFPSSKVLTQEIDEHNEFLEKLTNRFYKTIPKEIFEPVEIETNGESNGHMNGQKNGINGHKNHLPEQTKILKELRSKEIPILILLKSKIFKLLISICRSDQISDDLRDIINEYFQNFQFTIDKNPEPIVSETPLDTPAETPTETPSETPNPEN